MQVITNHHKKLQTITNLPEFLVQSSPPDEERAPLQMFLVPKGPGHKSILRHKLLSTIHRPFRSALIKDHA